MPSTGRGPGGVLDFGGGGGGIEVDVDAEGAGGAGWGTWDWYNGEGPPAAARPFLFGEGVVRCIGLRMSAGVGVGSVKEGKCRSDLLRDNARSDGSPSAEPGSNQRAVGVGGRSR